MFLSVLLSPTFFQGTCYTHLLLSPSEKEAGRRSTDIIFLLPLTILKYDSENQSKAHTSNGYHLSAHQLSFCPSGLSSQGLCPNALDWLVGLWACSPAGLDALPLTLTALCLPWSSIPTAPAPAYHTICCLAWAPLVVLTHSDLLAMYLYLGLWPVSLSVTQEPEMGT